MKYRKKPIEIEAVQYINFDPEEACVKKCFNAFPKWLEDAIECGNITYLVLCSPNRLSYKFAIKTLEGEMSLNKKAWIIRGMKGELYPCSDEIFKMTYEQVE